MTTVYLEMINRLLRGDQIGFNRNDKLQWEVLEDNWLETFSVDRLLTDTEIEIYNAAIRSE